MVRSSSAQEHPSKASDPAWEGTCLEGGRSYHQVTQTVDFWHGACRWHPVCSEGKGPGTSTPRGEGRWLNGLNLGLAGEMNFNPSVILLFLPDFPFWLLDCSASQTQQKASCYF